MNKKTDLLRKASLLILSAVIFLCFFNGYKAEGPARGKFKKLGEGEIDLTQVKEVKEENKVRDVSGDHRLKEWAGWWKRCAPGLALDSMESLGLSSLSEEELPPLTADQIGNGPAKAFYTKAPDGKRYLNPYWGRLQYKKEGEEWQPYVEVPCGAALYTPSAKSGRRIIDCSSLEGIDDAYWRDRDTIVLMGYTSISRQMNVECKTEESCVSPTVWIADLKANSVEEQHGPLMTRKGCELGGYLKKRLPNFFGKEQK